MVPPAAALAVTVLFLSLCVDRIIGDPHSRFHPVALLGRFIGWWGRPSHYSPKFQRFTGVVMWLVTVALFILPFFLVSRFAPWYLYILLAPFLLKICFAWRSLEEHALSVAHALSAGVEEGRQKVQMMVSRDTAQLDKEHILSAAFESLSENLTDSIVAPLFWYTVFGLTGAAGYRASNTMDAMLGYRDERAKIGWFPARMDDVLTYIPARISAALLLLWFATQGTFAAAYQVMRKDGHKRPGFNGGIVMAAMAGGCSTRFEKPGVYTLGNGPRPLEEAGPDIIRAARAVTLMLAILAGTALILLGGWINYIGI